MSENNNKSFVSINGKDNASLPVADRGLMYGDGLFETIAYRHQKLEFLNLHLERLAIGCERLCISLDFSVLKKEIFEFQQRVLNAGMDSAVIKVLVTRGMGKRGYRADPESEASRIFICDSWPSNIDCCANNYNNSKGFAIQVCKTTLSRSTILAGIKHLNRLEQVMARMEWDDLQIREGLLMDEFGKLIEGVSSNLFIVNAHGEILTPSLKYSGVAGVMRQHIKDNLAPKLGLSVSEAQIDRQQLADAKEVFLSNSLMGIQPVTACEGVYWPVGVISKKLQVALRDCEK